MKALLGTLMSLALVGCGAGTTGSSSGPAATAPATAVQQAPQADPHPLYTDKVVFIGDSISWIWDAPDRLEWADLLRAHLPNYVDAGISGNQTDQMLARFDTDVLASNPNVVVILGGINDIKNSEVDPATVASNLFAMVQKADSAGDKVIVGTVLAADSDYFPIDAQRLEVNAQVDALNKLIVAGASSYGYTVADYHTPMLGADGTADQSKLIDGLHPNDAGYVVMWEVLKPLLSIDSKAQ